ncbi:hypothetical protein ACFY9Q_21605 [Streptomyces sp. NPDC012389]|uniref:hypothetical protein n=1 Tax=unclassified Streptomyces TaxID=2593676 RepID=UPI00081EDE74|nr:MULTISPECIES: hypothetical protein [unclassified Streptomyces]MYR96470.1 hypothetical protein [Streptomyces sp. SID4937]MYX14124.1 hypothetical protein [Streptomyces sp. SID8374]SCE10244.1 hypothetical protein GA0115243_106442 [Streptomyces sp. ScaeMP-e83]
MKMTWGKKAATGALAGLLMTSGLALATAAPAQAAAAKYTCKATPSLSLGRPVSTSACTKSSKGKTVKQHRAVLVCDVVRGRGSEHTIPWTVKGDWKKPTEKSSVKCGFSSFLRSVKVETK